MSHFDIILVIDVVLHVAICDPGTWLMAVTIVLVSLSPLKLAQVPDLERDTKTIYMTTRHDPIEL